MIQPVFDPIVGRVVDEADVVWEEVDEAVTAALEFTDRTVQGEWFFTDLGRYQAVIDEVNTWNPAAQQAFVIRLEEALSR